MKKMMVFVFVIAVVLAGCSSEKTSTGEDTAIKELHTKIEKLEKEVEQYKKLEQVHQLEQDSFPFLSNLTLDFTRAQISGDQEKLKSLIAENLSVVKKEDGLYMVNQSTGDEWGLVYNGFQDMVIQGYGYDEAKETMSVHTRQFFKEAELPTFLTLIFKKINDEWKITDLSFDV
ncbi:lipoprotein [Bacillus sp. CGMCC 1.16607]|uniref:lipoprotein n=1 Tax=Bacillus sp. CGMCC 1.16607 TaxID=3351842 RepID=UPI0036290943